MTKYFVEPTVVVMHAALGLEKIGSEKSDPNGCLSCVLHCKAHGRSLREKKNPLAATLLTQFFFSHQRYASQECEYVAVSKSHRITGLSGQYQTTSQRDCSSGRVYNYSHVFFL